MRNSRYIRELIARRAACWDALRRVTNEWADLPLYADQHVQTDQPLPAGSRIVYVQHSTVDWSKAEVNYVMDEPDERLCIIDPRIRYGTLQ